MNAPAENQPPHHPFPPSRPSLQKRRGVALILVIAFIVLLSALVVAFFSRVSTELAGASSYAEGVSVRQLADTAVAVVEGQIRSATTTPNAAWASQPGMIRVYANGAQGSPVAGPNPYRFYKLYSSHDLIVSSAASAPWGEMANFDINNANFFAPAQGARAEVPLGTGGWMDQPAYFTDLNDPVSVQVSAGTTKLRYPIFDPGTSANPIATIIPPGGGAATQTGKMEGCEVHQGRFTAAEATRNAAPMPVRWLYVLRDGTLTAPTPLAVAATTGATSTGLVAGTTWSIVPTQTNPIVGRIAFWTDDETCKVNINTAAGVLPVNPATGALLDESNVDYGNPTSTPKAPANWALPSAVSTGAISAIETNPAFVAGNYWDTPRMDTFFDRGRCGGYIYMSDPTNVKRVAQKVSPDPTQARTFAGGLANSQVCAREYHRYPGHPATTSLGLVLKGLLPATLPAAAIPAIDNQYPIWDRLYAMTPRYIGSYQLPNDPAHPSDPVSDPTGLLVNQYGSRGGNMWSDTHTVGMLELKTGFQILAQLGGGVTLSTPYQYLIQDAPTPNVKFSSADPTIGVPNATAYPAGAEATNPVTFHFYASLDELAFSPVNGDRTPIDKALSIGAAPVTASDATGIITPTVVDQARFFLTAHNRAPELNLFGRPRVAIWPVQTYRRQYTLFELMPPLPPAGQSLNMKNQSDELIRFCSTIGYRVGADKFGTALETQDPTQLIRPGQFIFDREDPYGFSGGLLVPGGTNNCTDMNVNSTPRNIELFKYLQWLCGVPGTGGTAMTGHPGFAASTEVASPRFNTLYRKYQDGAGSTAVGALDGQGISQVLAEIFDYIRCVNLKDQTRDKQYYTVFGSWHYSTVPLTASNAPYMSNPIPRDANGNPTVANYLDVPGEMKVTPDQDRPGPDVATKQAQSRYAPRGLVIPAKFNNPLNTPAGTLTGFGRWPTISEAAIVFYVGGYIYQTATNLPPDATTAVPNPAYAPAFPAAGTGEDVIYDLSLIDPSPPVWDAANACWTPTKFSGMMYSLGSNKFDPDYPTSAEWYKGRTSYNSTTVAGYPDPAAVKVMGGAVPLPAYTIPDYTDAPGSATGVALPAGRTVPAIPAHKLTGKLIRAFLVLQCFSPADGYAPVSGLDTTRGEHIEYTVTAWSSAATNFTIKTTGMISDPNGKGLGSRGALSAAYPNQASSPWGTYVLNNQPTNFVWLMPSQGYGGAGLGGVESFLHMMQTKFYMNRAPELASAPPLSATNPSAQRFYPFQTPCELKDDGVRVKLDCNAAGNTTGAGTLSGDTLFSFKGGTITMQMAFADAIDHTVPQVIQTVTLTFPDSTKDWPLPITELETSNNYQSTAAWTSGANSLWPRGSGWWGDPGGFDPFPACALSATLASGSSLVTVSSTVGMPVGQAVYGPGIPAGAKIASIANATQFNLSAAATATGAVTVIYFRTDYQIADWSADPAQPLGYAVPSSSTFSMKKTPGQAIAGRAVNNNFHDWIITNYSPSGPDNDVTGPYIGTAKGSAPGPFLFQSGAYIQKIDDALNIYQRFNLGNPIGSLGAALSGTPSINERFRALQNADGLTPVNSAKYNTRYYWNSAGWAMPYHLPARLAWSSYNAKTQWKNDWYGTHLVNDGGDPMRYWNGHYDSSTGLTGMGWRWEGGGDAKNYANRGRQLIQPGDTIRTLVLGALDKPGFMDPRVQLLQTGGAAVAVMRPHTRYDLRAASGVPGGTSEDTIYPRRRAEQLRNADGTFLFDPNVEISGVPGASAAVNTSTSVPTWVGQPLDSQPLGGYLIPLWALGPSTGYSTYWGPVAPYLPRRTLASATNQVIARQDSGGNAGVAWADFDTGVGNSPDGGFINKADEGNLARYTLEFPPLPEALQNWDQSKPYPPLDPPTIHWVEPYYNSSTYEPPLDTYFSPNRQIPGPGMFGSLLAGQQGTSIGNPTLVYNKGYEGWKTLLFCPNPASALTNTGAAITTVTSRHGGAISPPDHLLLDLFWMPVVEPYAISEPFSTDGKVNLNYQIMPFTYIKRSTALRAVLHGMRVTAIPNFWTNTAKQFAYKGQTNPENVRYLIDRDNTIHAIDDFFGLYQPSVLAASAGSPAKGPGEGFFKSASQICERFLYPKGSVFVPTAQTTTDAATGYTQSFTKALITYTWTPNAVSGINSAPDVLGNGILNTFWKYNALTGDNLREKPYTDMYPRLTTKSNTFTVHYRVQSLRQRPYNGLSADAAAATWYATWDEKRDQVLSEYRGSTTIERYLDPQDARFKCVDGSGVPTAAALSARTYGPKSIKIMPTSQPSVTTLPNGPDSLETAYMFKVINEKRFQPW